MKKIMKRFAWKSTLVLAMLAASVAGCSGSKEFEDGGGDEYDYTDVIDTYVDDLVIPTYADMKEKAWALLEKVTAFSTDQTEANLEAACQAWLDVRAPWELSEAFLYGPCGENGLNVDPNIDTWPFNMTDFMARISGSDPLTVANISFYPEETRGFHTLEYLMFRQGNPRDLTTLPFSARELQYLVSAATVLRNDCIRVWACWKGITGLNTRDQQAVTDMTAIDYWDVAAKLAEWEADSYATIFKNVKRPYTSQENVVEEIIDGICTIAAEVAESKIESPAAGGGNVDLVESQYSYNSLKDFTDNIYSIRNAYYGSMTGTVAAGSLATFVKTREDGGTELHNDIVSAINNAIAKINAIQAPFALHLNDAANISAAVEACSDVEQEFLKIKLYMDI